MKHFLWIYLITVLETSCDISQYQNYVIPPIKDKGRHKRHTLYKGYRGQPNVEIQLMNITTLVSERFARTQIVSNVKNYSPDAQEVLFATILPYSAYISEFVMEIGNKSYQAVAKDKEESRQLYKQTVTSGQAGGLVETTARDSERFQVHVNVEGGEKVIFRLTYEELLQRSKNKYEVVLNIQPSTFINKLNVQVDIKDSIPLSFVGIPPLRSGNDISSYNDLYSNARMKSVNKNWVTIKYNPSKNVQEEIANKMGTSGFAVQFVVQYDVKRGSTADRLLTANDHFVYFFAPSNLIPLPKHAIFVLDTSGSMSGNKIENLKEAMKVILDKLRPADIFNIVQFSSTISIWNIITEAKNTFVGSNYAQELKNVNMPSEFTVTPENIEHAKKVIDKLVANDATNIMGALEMGILLAQTQKDSKSYESVIIFLTDGLPNEGIQNPNEIINRVASLNVGDNKAGIFTLAFGDDADEDFLYRLSRMNYASYRHIYDSADASHQLKEFFQDYAAPLLKAVQLEYEDGSAVEMSETNFPMYYDGSELIFSGQLKNGSKFVPVVKAIGVDKTYEYKPEKQETVADLEKLFAYLSIKQKTEELKIYPNKSELKEEIINKSLKYNYVTPLTSLVIDKPNGQQEIADLVDASPKGNAQAAVTTTTTSTTTTTTTTTTSRPISYDTTLFQLVNNVHQQGSKKTFGFGLTDDDDDFGLLHWLPRPKPKKTLEELKSLMPWLQSTLNADGTLAIKGGWYHLGFNEPIFWKFICMNSVNDTIGECKLIDQCYPKMEEFVKSAEDMENHFCPLNEYAGVCCPTE